MPFLILKMIEEITFTKKDSPWGVAKKVKEIYDGSPVKIAFEDAKLAKAIADNEKANCSNGHVHLGELFTDSFIEAGLPIGDFTVENNQGKKEEDPYSVLLV